MTPEELNDWLPIEQQRVLVSRLVKRLGVTRTRAECFVRLWTYLLVKHYRTHLPQLKPPLGELEPLIEPISCTHREAAILFYGDRERGSDRAAGMMLDKLAALGLIKKTFDGNQTAIEIQAVSEAQDILPSPPVDLTIDAFDPRCDAIPVANLLARNYNWMNRSTEAMPQRIARLLRQWAQQYPIGMRVLRRSDNLHPVGFYLLYPITSDSETNFFKPPSTSLHLSTLAEVDPFTLAKPGDPNCLAVFIRSWMIDEPYLLAYRAAFIADAQKTLIQMQQDFPQLCDLYTLLIHPSFEGLAEALGFQKTSKDPQLSISWMYLALDRFLQLDVQVALA